MAPQFCDDCGMILDESGEQSVKCDVCGRLNANHISAEPKVSTSNKFPSSLRTKLQSNTQAVTAKNQQSKQTIQVGCLKCDASEVNWFEMQLRSADEGSTIFYDCPKCGHRWNENN